MTQATKENIDKLNFIGIKNPMHQQTQSRE
jgi:hypothetical protein